MLKEIQREEQARQKEIEDRRQRKREEKLIHEEELRKEKEMEEEDEKRKEQEELQKKLVTIIVIINPESLKSNQTVFTTGSIMMEYIQFVFVICQITMCLLIKESFCKMLVTFPGLIYSTLLKLIDGP